MREDFSVQRVDRRERARGRRFAARAGVFDALQQRFFGLALQAEVERDLEAVAGLGRGRSQARGHGIAFGVDLHALHAVSPRR